MDQGETVSTKHPGCSVCKGSGSVLIEVNDGGPWYDICPAREAELERAAKQRKSAA